MVDDLDLGALRRVPRISYYFRYPLHRGDFHELSHEKRKGHRMAKTFKVGDHVSWNSEAGRVSGRIIKVHTRDFDYKGHTHRASKDDPQYEIKSDKTDHIAAHKGSALHRA